MLKKIVIAPDSFKGSMSSIEVCNIVEEAAANILPEFKTVKIPVADGGEGTVDAFLSALGGRKIPRKVKGPLFTHIEAFYGILQNGNTAVVEIAAAAGLVLAGDKKNPCVTTTYGVGQLMKDALDQGCTRIIIGLGGSATNDGGIGMAAALGAGFFDKSGNEVPLNGTGLGSIDRIDISGMDKRLKDVDIIAACDVDNPLYGPNGAAYVYSPQKGADEKMVKFLDSNLKHYADMLKKHLGNDIGIIPGAGAAGGLGAGVIAFAGGKLAPGIQIMLDTVKFDEVLSDAGLVITGEGKIDGQSLRGKVPVGIAQRAAAKNVPVVAIVGDIGEDIEKVYEKGISAVFSINQVAVPFSQARLRSREDLKKTVENLFRFIRITGMAG